MNRLRIGFCNILYSKKNDRGGLGSHIQDLSQELAKAGHDITILTSGQSKVYFEGSVRIVQLGSVPRFSGIRQLFTPSYWFHRFAYMWKLAAYIRKNHFDVVEAAEGGAEQLLIVLQHICPVVTKLHGNFRHIYNRRFIARIVEFFERMGVEKSDGVYTSSLSYAKTIASEYKISLNRIAIIPYGIRVDELYKPFPEEPPIAGPTKEETKTVLLSVGSSPVRKGVVPFLEAASKLIDQNIRFILLSSDDSLEAPIRIPENVIHLGHLDRPRFYSVLSSADIVVFPSLFESFGIAAYEAMLLEKIVILSNYVPLEGSAKNYGRCFVLETLTGSSLATAITDVFAGRIKFPLPDPEILRQMKEEYDIKNIAQSVLHFYEEIILAGKKTIRSLPAFDFLGSSRVKND